jgi:hypothetical protein
MKKITLERMIRLWIYFFIPLAIFFSYKAYSMYCNDYADRILNENLKLISLAFILAPFIFLIIYFYLHIIWVGKKPTLNDIKVIISNSKSYLKKYIIYIHISILVALIMIFKDSYYCYA